MKYYIITYKLAKQLGCIGHRFGSKKEGYLVNSADLNIDTVVNNPDDIKEVSWEEARIFIYKYKKL